MDKYSWDNPTLDENFYKNFASAKNPTQFLTGEISQGAQSQFAAGVLTDKISKGFTDYYNQQASQLKALHPELDPEKYIDATMLGASYRPGEGASSNRDAAAVRTQMDIQARLAALTAANNAANGFKTSGKVENTTKDSVLKKLQANLDETLRYNNGTQTARDDISRAKAALEAYKNNNPNIWTAGSEGAAQQANAAAARVAAPLPYDTKIGDIAPGGAITNESVATGTPYQKLQKAALEGTPIQPKVADMAPGGNAQSAIQMNENGDYIFRNGTYKTLDEAKKAAISAGVTTPNIFEKITRSQTGAYVFQGKSYSNLELAKAAATRMGINTEYNDFTLPTPQGGGSAGQPQRSLYKPGAAGDFQYQQALNRQQGTNSPGSNGANSGGSSNTSNQKTNASEIVRAQQVYANADKLVGTPGYEGKTADQIREGAHNYANDIRSGKINFDGTPTNPQDIISQIDDQANADMQNELDLIEKNAKGKVDLSKSANLVQKLVGMLDEQKKAPPQSLEQTFEDKRKELGLQGLEGELAAKDAELKKLESDYASTQEGEENRTVSMGTIRKRQSAQDLAYNKIKRDLMAERDSIATQINQKYDVLNTMMTLAGKDFDNAQQEYQQEWNQTIQLSNIIQGIDESTKSDQEKKADNARANLQIMQNLLKSGNVSYDKLDETTKLGIKSMEMSAGLPPGFTQFVTDTVDAPVVSHLPQFTDENGNLQQPILTVNKQTGAYEIQNISLGKEQAKKNTGTGGGVGAGKKTPTLKGASGDYNDVLNIPMLAKGGQCGHFVNQYTGLGMGDSYASKMAKMDDSIDTPEPGMVFVMPYKKTGHTGFIIGMSADGKTATVKDSNYGLNEKVYIHTIPVSKMKGFRRVTDSPNGVPLTATEKKKLEQAGLSAASRQKQLEYLYKPKTKNTSEEEGA